MTWLLLHPGWDRSVYPAEKLARLSDMEERLHPQIMGHLSLWLIYLYPAPCWVWFSELRPPCAVACISEWDYVFAQKYYSCFLSAAFQPVPVLMPRLMPRLRGDIHSTSELTKNAPTSCAQHQESVLLMITRIRSSNYLENYRAKCQKLQSMYGHCLVGGEIPIYGLNIDLEPINIS